jgi:hypothetical protein
MPEDKANKPHDILQEALEAYDAGFSLLPIKEDGSKEPDVSGWASSTRMRMLRDHVSAMYTRDKRSGLGIIMGMVYRPGSDHELAPIKVEALDFDNREVFNAFIAQAEQDPELSPIVERVRNGYEDDTPGGGVRWLYRCAEIEGNQKLAVRPGEPDEKGKSKNETLIETRGMGGFAIFAPTNGKVHPSKKPYVRQRGGFDSVTTLTLEERVSLLDQCRSFDQQPNRQRREQRERSERGHKASGKPSGSGNVALAFNQHAAWEDILGPHGYTVAKRAGRATHWNRPDAENPGKTDLTTNHDGTDRAFSFSASVPLPTEQYLSKFAAFTHLNHGGDFSKAAKELVGLGYGTANTPNEKKSAPRDFPVYTDDEVENLPSPTYLVKPYLLKSTIATLYGMSEAGKSLWALALCLCIALGIPFYGAPVSQGAVLYAAAEGTAGIKGRLIAWKRHFKHVGKIGARFLFREVNFLDESDVEGFLSFLRTLPEPPVLLVIDTLAWAMVGGNENDAKDIMQVLEGARRIRDEFGTTVLLLHHTGKTGELERGSSALRNGSDTMLKMSRDMKKGKLIKLVVDKQKDGGEKPAPNYFTIKSIAIGELPDAAAGDDMILDVTTAPVLVEADLAKANGEPDSDEQPLWTDLLTESERVGLDVLNRLNGIDGPVSMSIWLQTAAEDPNGLSRATVYRIRLELIEKGFITLTDGRYSITAAGVEALETTPFSRKKKDANDAG